MIENIFLKRFETKSESELEHIINNKEIFTEQARIAAIQILEKRNGGSLANQKSEVDIEVNKENKKNSFLTDDLNAPELHSKRVITVFALVFSTIFGAVLLMHNFKEVGNAKSRNQVLIFGILYTIASIAIVNSFHIKGNLALFLNIVGATILTEYFWNKHLGKEINYRQRSWIKPAIISTIIMIPIVFALIYG
jgi:hypothetical protein